MNNDGYTNPLQGRTLSSLADEEIRSIAETWLLKALKDTNLFLMQTAPERERVAVIKQRKATPDEVQEVLESLGYVDKEPTPKKRKKALPSVDPLVLDNALAEQAQADAELAGKIQAMHQKALASNRVTGIAFEADMQIQAQGLIADASNENAAAVAAGSRPSASYLKACQELLKTRATFYSVMEQIRRGEFTAYDQTVERLEAKHCQRKKNNIPMTVNAPTIPEEKTLLLPAALEQFFEEKKREGSWKERTQVKERDKFDLFQAIIDPEGVLPVVKLSAEHMRRYKKVLYGLPKNRTNNKKYLGITLQELIQRAEAGTIPPEDRIAPRTIGNHCIQIATFINWASRNEYHSNPKITGLLHVAKTKQDHENRDPYNREDLAKIFAPKDFLTAGLTVNRGKRKKDKNGYFLPDSGGNPSRFWVPLLGLFTGARLEELAQLHLNDIVAVNKEGNARNLFISGHGQPLGAQSLLRDIEERQETLCMFIWEGENQSVKTKSSKRYVPLSPLLTQELDFIGYLNAIHKKSNSDNPTLGEGRLFPELLKRHEADTYSSAVSKWYQRYRGNIGITRGNGGGRKDFHSFRDTIAYWCDQIGNVDEKPTARYLGHAYSTMTFGLYSKDTAPHILYTAITLPFTEYTRNFLDVEGLKASRWAGNKE